MAERVGEPIPPVSVSKLTQTRSPAGLREIRPSHATCGAENRKAGLGAVFGTGTTGIYNINTCVEPETFRALLYRSTLFY